MVISPPQISEKSSTGTNTLRLNPTAMDQTPTQPCQPHNSPYQHVKELLCPVENLISVPILYGLDNGALNEGHVTELNPLDNSRSFAWGMGPSGINTNIATTRKRPTLTQSTNTSKELLDTQVWVGTKRASRDHQKHEPETNMEKTKRQRVLAETTKPPILMVTVLSQPRQSP